MSLMMGEKLQIAFARFGVTITAAEAAAFAKLPAHEAITHLLASREIAARFDAAHVRVPNDTDIELLVDAVEAQG